MGCVFAGRDTFTRARILRRWIPEPPTRRPILCSDNLRLVAVVPFRAVLEHASVEN